MAKESTQSVHFPAAGMLWAWHAPRNPEKNSWSMRIIFPLVLLPLFLQEGVPKCCLGLHLDFSIVLLSNICNPWILMETEILFLQEICVQPSILGFGSVFFNLSPLFRFLALIAHTVLPLCAVGLSILLFGKDGDGFGRRFVQCSSN